MTLADLVDVEVQVARDRAADPASLEARDRRLLPTADRGAPRAIVLQRWVQAIREREPGAARAGRVVALALGTTRVALGLLGLAVGWAAATQVLQFTGVHPVNVWNFLLVFVGLQVLLLLLLLTSFVLPVGETGVQVFGLFRAVVGAGYRWLVARGLRGEARLEEWGVVWHTLRARRSLYHAIEPWLLLRMTQTFGVAFNLGALAGCMRLIVFSDIAFGWSTTLLELGPARFHAIVRGLATPWAWAWPEAVPSASLVAATQYSRLEGAYLAAGVGRSAQPSLVGGWWPFLVAALVCYGLLPRLVLLSVACVRGARVLARFPFEDPELSRVVERLTGADVETRSLSAEAPGPEWPVSNGAARGQPEASFQRCVTVLWRDVPSGSALTAAVARSAGCGIGAVISAGGRDYDEGRVDWALLAQGADSAIVVAEGWESPDRSVLRLVRALRSALGDGRVIRVALIGRADADRIEPPTMQDVKLWRDGLARLADPYVAVEPLGAAS